MKVWNRRYRAEEYNSIIEFSSIGELKNTVEGFSSRLDAEEYINDLENRSVELIQIEQQREKKIFLK